MITATTDLTSLVARYLWELRNPPRSNREQDLFSSCLVASALPFFIAQNQTSKGRIRFMSENFKLPGDRVQFFPQPYNGAYCDAFTCTKMATYMIGKPVPTETWRMCLKVCPECAADIVRSIPEELKQYFEPPAGTVLITKEEYELLKNEYEKQLAGQHSHLLGDIGDLKLNVPNKHDHSIGENDDVMDIPAGAIHYGAYTLQGVPPIAGKQSSEDGNSIPPTPQLGPKKGARRK